MTTTTTINTYTKLRSGEWGVRVTTGPVAQGDQVTVSKKDGSTARETIARVVWTGEGVSLCEIERGVVLLLWRSLGWPWSDAPYSWHRQTRGADPVPVPSVEALPPGAGVPLDMLLVDAATGRLAAMRKVAMPGAFALELHHAIGEQALTPHAAWGGRAYDAAVADLAAEPAEVLAARAAHRCTIGSAPGRPS